MGVQSLGKMLKCFTLYRIIALYTIFFVFHAKAYSKDRVDNEVTEPIEVLLGTLIQDNTLTGGLRHSLEQQTENVIRDDLSDGSTFLDIPLLNNSNVYDSSAKLPSGILRGNANQLRDFHQCLSVMGSEPNTPTEMILGQYCLASIDISATPHAMSGKESLETPAHLAQSIEIIKSSHLDPGHILPQYSTIMWGLCVPHSCTPNDVDASLKNALSHFGTSQMGLQIETQVDSDMCYVDQPTELSVKTVIVILNQTYRTYNMTYTVPSHQATPYMFGIWLGYFLHKNDSKIHIPKHQVYGGWLSAVYLIYLSFFSMSEVVSPEYQYDAVKMSIYYALSPVAFSLALSWVILACVTGHGGWLNSTLCWRGLTIFSKISYCVYLTQFLVFFYNVGTTKTSQEFNAVTVYVRLCQTG